MAEDAKDPKDPKAATAPAAPAAPSLSLDTEVAADTVTASTQPVGLAPVLTQHAAGLVANDIAEIVLDTLAVRGPVRVLVTSDPAVVAGFDALTLLDIEVTELRRRLDEVPAGAGTADHRSFAPVLPLIGLGVQAFGLLTRIRQRSYQTSSAVVDVSGLGFDLQVARQVQFVARPHEEVTVVADRLARAEPDGVLARLSGLARSADGRLRPALAAAGVRAAVAAAAVERLGADLTALDAQLTALVALLGKDPDVAGSPSAVVAELDRLRTERAGVAGQLPDAARERAAADAALAERTGLAADVAALLTEAFTVPAGGGRAPAAVAARLEPFATGSACVLYVRAVAGGIDRVVETKLGADKWSSLAGFSAEYACVRADGTFVTGGVRTAYSRAVATLAETRSFRQEAPPDHPLYSRPRARPGAAPGTPTG